MSDPKQPDTRDQAPPSAAFEETERPTLLGPVMLEDKPDPQEVLRALLRSRRGKHKIYVGAAPGVGKTYRAIQELLERKSQGVDAIIGYLEAHGRADVKTLASELEVFPRQSLEYRGAQMTEMDLAGLLARKPQLVLVDELQHTNAPGAKHKKRFVDVDELLNAGISVVSTLNIQHLESLMDLVERMTGVRVKDRVPDRVVLEADELVLVDVTPEQLQERLKAGKIYANERIETALSSFFTEENLTHLRELALRQVADAVEEAPQPEEMLARGMKERIAVAFEAKPESARLIRRGARVAQRLKAELHVIFVETRPPSAEEKRTLEAFEKLTAELDAEFHVIPSKNVTDAIVSFTRANDITQIIMGETHRSKWQEFVGGNIIHEVMRRTHDVDVYVIADE